MSRGFRTNKPDGSQASRIRSSHVDVGRGAAKYISEVWSVGKQTASRSRKKVRLIVPAIALVFVSKLYCTVENLAFARINVNRSLERRGVSKH